MCTPLKARNLVIKNKETFVMEREESVEGKAKEQFILAS